MKKKVSFQERKNKLNKKNGKKIYCVCLCYISIIFILKRKGNYWFKFHIIKLLLYILKRNTLKVSKLDSRSRDLKSQFMFFNFIFGLYSITSTVTKSGTKTYNAGAFF